MYLPNCTKSKRPSWLYPIMKLTKLLYPIKYRRKHNSIKNSTTPIYPNGPQDSNQSLFPQQPLIIRPSKPTKWICNRFKGKENMGAWFTISSANHQISHKFFVYGVYHLIWSVSNLNLVSILVYMIFGSLRYRVWVRVRNSRVGFRFARGVWNFFFWFFLKLSKISDFMKLYLNTRTQITCISFSNKSLFCASDAP